MEPSDLKKRILLICFFLSGAAGLVFEVVWSRYLTLVFGATSVAISTVLTAFMGGLALGAFLSARFGDSIRDPVRAYAGLELFVAAWGFGLPWAMGGLPEVYSLLWTSLGGPGPALVGLRFVLAMALLLPPTVAMGATLPFLTRVLARGGRVGRGAGALYTANTLGAVLGAGMAGFALMPLVGVRATNYAAALMDAAAGVMALLLLPRLGEGRGRPDDWDDPESLLTMLHPPREREPYGWERLLVATAFGVSGLLSMAQQVLWSRALAIVLGSSVYSFSMVLFVFLLGHGLGAGVTTRLLPRLQRPLATLATILSGAALAALVGFAMLDELPGWHLKLLHHTEPTVPLVFGLDAAFVVLVVSGPALLSGMVFPLVVHLLQRGPDGVARTVGSLYGFNTVGSIAGSMLAGFLLLPVLGLGGGIRVLAAGSLAVGVALAVAAHRARLEGASPPRLPALVALAAAVLLVALPDLRPGKLAAGMFRVVLAQSVFTRGEFTEPEVLYYKDGQNATVTVEARDDLLTLKANGKPEASNTDDMPTQIAVGLVPLLFNPRPSSVLMVGLGSGVSAGAALAHPGVEHLRVLELEEAMVEASRFFWEVNRQPWTDPRLELILTDARTFLEVDPERYDVIISEPSNPWITGVSNLFTVEHFRAVAERLAPGGVFCQWLQLYEISPENVRSIMATVHEVFPEAMVFVSKPVGADLLIVARRDGPVRLDLPRLGARWGLPGVAEELARAELQDVTDLAALLFLRPGEVAGFAGNAKLNTDDNALVEFSAPFDLVRSRLHEEWYVKLFFADRVLGNPLEEDLGLPPAGTTEGRSWRGRLARALLRGGRMEQGVELLARVIDQGEPIPPEAEEAARVMALLDRDTISLTFAIGDDASQDFVAMARLIREGRWGDALDRYHDLPPRERDAPENLLILGYLLYQDHRQEDAVEVLRPLMRIPGFVERRPIVSYLLARALGDLAEYHESYDLMARFSRDLVTRANGDEP